MGRLFNAVALAMLFVLLSGCTPPPKRTPPPDYDLVERWERLHWEVEKQRIYSRILLDSLRLLTIVEITAPEEKSPDEWCREHREGYSGDTFCI